MTRKEIFKYLLEYIEKGTGSRCIVTYHNGRDRYNAEYTYNEFKIEGRKDWRFGVWIMSSREDKEYSVHLFGEHEWFIDKFKPTATEISCEPFKVKKNCRRIADDPVELFMFTNTIHAVKKSSVASLIKYYWNGRYSPVKWLANMLWYNKVSSPLREWHHDYGMIVPLSISKFLYKLKFGSKVDVNIHSNRDFAFPKWDFQVVYNTEDDDEIAEMYGKIHANGNLFIPDWLYDGYVCVIDALDKDDWTGFYIEDEK